MPYIYTNVRKLEKQAKVGDSECVALIRQYTLVPATCFWRRGTELWATERLQAEPQLPRS